jgi:hypothetical protein
MNPGQLLCAISCGDFAAPRKGWLVYQSDSGWNLRTYYADGLSTAVNITGNNGAPAQAGVWTHLVVSWDGSRGRVYVDGVLRVTSDPRPYVAGLAGGFNVGSRSDGAFQWNGDADEVAFYNTALSDADVAAHFANGNAAAPSPTYDALVLASNPVGYWRMTESFPGPVPPDQVAVSFWQKLEFTSDSSSFWVASPSSNNGERGFQAHVPWSNGDIYFDTAGCCDPPQRINGASGAVPGEWEHYVFQKDGEHKEVWRNGVKILEGDFAARLPNDFYRLTIGAQTSGQGGANAVRGMIDDFAVFGDPLNPAQIAELAGGATPLSLIQSAPLDFTQVQDFLSTKVRYRLEDLMKCGCESTLLGDLLKQFELDETHTFRLFIKPFMDALTWDEDRIDRCCTHVIRPDGKLDSFCRYYSGFADCRAG